MEAQRESLPRALTPKLPCSESPSGSFWNVQRTEKKMLRTTQCGATRTLAFPTCVDHAGLWREPVSEPKPRS